ncbi:MAG TPA: hypothetical protein ENH06_00990 [bacterium]|nr:hypothetical protein [bacterium]
MAITFLKKKKKQKNLVQIFLLIVFMLLLFFLYNLQHKKQDISVVTEPVLEIPEIEINWVAVQDKRLEEFNLFEEIKPFEEEIGREDPFLPY